MFANVCRTGNEWTVLVICGPEICKLTEGQSGVNLMTGERERKGDDMMDFSLRGKVVVMVHQMTLI